MFGVNQLNTNMCMNPAAVSSSAINFAAPITVNSINQRLDNSTVMNNSALNFNNFPPFNTTDLGFSTSVNVNNLISNNSISSTNMGNTMTPSIKEEGEEDGGGEDGGGETGEQVMDCIETHNNLSSNDNGGLSRYADLSNQTESMINFLSTIGE